MKRLVCIIAGDPNSINSEIIGKIWKKKNLFKSLNIFVVGSYSLFNKQLKEMGLKINIKKITNIENQNFNKELLIYDIPLKFKKPFNVSIKNKARYIFKCFQVGIDFARKKKVLGLINCPINKSEVFGNKTSGVTEFLAKKEGVLGKEVMLIFNKKLSVSPITTHIKVKNISKNLTKKLIINKLDTINEFFKEKFKFKPRIGLIGLNPHNFEFRRNSEEIQVIMPALKKLKRRGILIYGPLSGDTAFTNLNKYKLNVLVGMYHDQVLSPFKALYKFNAINITLGLPYLRVSPDHGTGKDIVKKNKANPLSLLKSISFFKSINVKT